MNTSGVQQAPEESASQGRGPKGRALRWLQRAALAIVSLAILWLIAVNVWLAVWGESVLSRRPEKMQVSYSRAWSFWPGRVVASDLMLSAETARNQWQLRADRAVLSIDLLQLSDREFVLRRGRVDGADFRLRRLASEGQELEQALRYLPPIEVYQFRTARMGPPKPSAKKPWRVILNDLVLQGLREVWFDEMHLRAPSGNPSAVGSVHGALEVVMRGDLSLDDVKVSWSGAELAIAENVTGENLELSTDLTLAATSSRSLRQPDTFSGLNGRIQAGANVENLDFLRALLPPSQQFVVNGRGQLSLLALVQNGELVEGSTLELRAPELETQIASFSGSGKGSVKGAIELRDETRWVNLDVELKDVELAAQSAVRSAAQSSGRSSTRLGGQSSGSIAKVQRVQLTLEGERPRLGAPVESYRVLLEMPALQIPDLTVFADLIPKGLGIDLLGGAGVAVTRLELREDIERSDFEFEAKNAKLQFRGTHVEGTLKLAGKTSGRRSTGRLSLEDAQVSFRGSSRPTGQRRSRAWPVEFDLELGDTEFLLPPTGSGLTGGFRLATGVVEITGRAADLGWWETPMPGAEWLKLGGQAALSARLQVVGSGRSTRLVAPSELRLDVPNLAAQLGRWTAQAKGVLEGRLVQDRGSNQSQVELLLGSASVVRTGAPPLAVPSVSLRASGPDLSRGLDLEATRLTLKAARTDIDNLAIFNDYFPSQQLSVQSGRGTLEGSLRFSGNSADGRLQVESPGVEATIAGEAVHAQLSLETRLASDNPSAGRFTLNGSTLRLTNVAFPNLENPSGDWWAIVDLGDGQVQIEKPLKLDTLVKLRLRDTEPLIHLIGKSRNLVRWFSRLLEVQNIDGTGRLILDETGLRIHDLDVSGNGLSIHGRIDLRDETAALLLIELRGLRAGIEINGDWRDVNVLRPRKWFAERSAVWSGH